MKNRVIWIAFLSFLFFTSSAYGKDKLKGPLPDVNLKTLEGKNISLHKLAKGKVTLIVFSAFYCGECIKLITYLNDLEKKFNKKKNFLLISIISREKLKKLRKYKQNKGIKYEVLLEPTGHFIKKYRIYMFPTVKLFDRHGKLIYEALVPNKNKLKQLIEDLV